MTFSKKSSFLLVAVAMLMSVTACGGGDTLTVTGPYFSGYAAKSSYNAFLSSSISTLNYAKSQNAADGRHVANFVDGLVMNDEYGILRRKLASSASHSADYKEYTFEIREDVPWLMSDGTQFVANGEAQVVIADDFVNSAEIILNYGNSSEVSYLVALFLQGGWEYYSYTFMNSLINKKGSQAYYPTNGEFWDEVNRIPYSIEHPATTPNQCFNYGSLKNASDAQKAAQLTLLTAHEGGLDPSKTIVTGSQLADVSTFKRVGIRSDVNDKYKLVYTLSDSMAFFPTVLTYGPFYPINRAFFSQQKMAGFGTSKDKILYNGPFLCTTWEGNDVKYLRNEQYYDLQDVHIQTVNYKVIESSAAASYTRDQFDAGAVDGFALSRDDEKGWSDYITGPNGDGTIQSPYSPLVNSRELNLIDFLFCFDVNINRDSSVNATNAKVMSTEAEIDNANQALKIKEVRNLLLNGIDLSVYNKIFVEVSGAEERDQYQVNTFVPRNFARDANDKDYVDYFIEEYAQQTGVSVETAKEKYAQQQIDGVNYFDPQYAQIKSELADPAKNAVAKYNEGVADSSIGDDGETAITLPITVEVLGNSNELYRQYDRDWIEGFNERANGCRIYTSNPYTAIELPSCESLYGQAKYPFIQLIINTRATDSSSWSTLANNASYSFGEVWGWGPDYADPLTYFNQYVSNGDHAKYGGWSTGDFSYKVGGDNKISKYQMLSTYDGLIDLAKAETASTQKRYEYFAEAEYELHTNVLMSKPSYMASQGWTASVSRAIGYENPDAPYGMASYRLDGMWVLVDVPTGAARKEARATQASLKEQALIETGHSLIAIYD
ncbi:MAG: ABC transporter substrate-binding protein [Bacilli bacterium]